MANSTLSTPSQKQYLGNYDSNTLHQFIQREALREAAFFTPYLKAGMNLLDCGCGPGTITVGLAALLNPGTVIGIDVAEEQFEIGRSLARDRQLSHITFQKADIYNLPFPDESFDAVFIHAVLYHLNNPLAALKEVYRVLKPEGVLGVRESNQEGEIYAPPEIPIQSVWNLLYKVHAYHGGNPQFGKTLKEAFRKTGLVDIIVSASYDCYNTHEAIKNIGTMLNQYLKSPRIYEVILAEQWADQAEIEKLQDLIETWIAHPDAFMARCRCEAVGWKKSPGFLQSTD